MRFHLLALPNAQTTKAYSLDGFAMATMRFARMLKEMGHTVFLYGSEENEALCDEFISCITKEEIECLLGDIEYQHALIDEKNALFQLANARMIKEIRKRKQIGDFLCMIGGCSQQCVANANPEIACIEYSIGYTGSFSKYRVFESTAWRHTTYGFQGHEDGRVFDQVIPLGFNSDEFKFNDKKEPFALYVGRITPRKGVALAIKASKEAGLPLKIIGHGEEKFKRELLVGDHIEFLGGLPMEERNAWMSRAQVVLCPTVYVEPFNCVAIEAQMCGTPVISTDYGGFTETVEHDKTGFRCTYLAEFVQAIKDSAKLDHAYIRQRALDKYSLDAVKPQYQRYFERVAIMNVEGPDTMTVIPSLLN